MKKLTKILLTCGILAGCLSQASAALTMRLSADNGATWVVVTDNGPFDINSTTGFINYTGPVGASYVTVSTGFGSPLIGTPITPLMDVGTSTSAYGAGKLIVQLSDTGFVPFANETYVNTFGGTASGAVVFNVYRDNGNVLFGSAATYSGDPAGISPSPSATTLFAVGPFNGDNYSSNAVMVAAGGNSPYALTLETVIADTVGGQTTSDGLLYALNPPPCNCTLTFLSPQFLTNCASDIIPDVIAAQNCGVGLSNLVKVTMIGAVTNGSCPKIITRTNTASDSCGDVFTFVQTITVNCKGNICGHVFADCDGSGDLTTGDVGIGKVTVSLVDASNHVIATQVSDVNGGYCFTNLAGGNYTVTINPPAGYCQTAASTAYHWKDSYGRTCWQENDGYIHCTSSGTECWWDKSNTCHWKDSYNRDCWKDNYGVVRCQSLNYKSCNAPSNNNTITVSLTNCTSQLDVNFAYAGSKPSVAVCVTGPSYVKCGQTYTYTCTVTNTGNVCFQGGNVCHVIGNCNWGNWGYGCNVINTPCPPLSPGQRCTLTVKCSFSSWNCGQVACQSTASCNQYNGSTSGQSLCYSQCGW